MKVSCRLLLTVLTLIILPHAALAKASVDNLDAVNDNAGNNTTTGGSGASASSAGATNIPTTASGNISIACIDDSGKAVNTSGNTCAALLPKCSTLKTSYEKSVKDFLTWKIWGYYQGKNIDLNTSTLNAKAPVFQGPDLLYPVCSVVGHKLQFSGQHPMLSPSYAPCEIPRKSIPALYQGLGIEYVHQTIGRNASCGSRPLTTNPAGHDKMNISFSGGNGSLWSSYIVGAYPWLIRRHAYDVLTALKPDLSNLSDVVSSDAVKKNLATLSANMTTYYTTLSSQVKTACDAGASDLVNKCSGKTPVSLTDPVARLCTLASAQNTVNNGAIPNMLVMEIMSRVQKQYDSLFLNLVTLQSGWGKKLYDKCNNTGAYGRSTRGQNALKASCLFDGASFATFQDMTTEENDCKGSESRSGKYPVLTRIEDGGVEGVIDNSAIVAMKFANSSHSLNFGFAGLVESIIRRDICKQIHYTDKSICDDVNIPDQPAGTQ